MRNFCWLFHRLVYAYVVLYFFFFFSSRRRHTRLVSDWSSDVCSSDLEVSVQAGCLVKGLFHPEDPAVSCFGKDPLSQIEVVAIVRVDHDRAVGPDRSEERRVGKECRSRGAPYL